jgi:hypothetical protein
MQPYYLDDISFLYTQGLPKNSKILKSTKPSIHQPFTRSILATLSVWLELMTLMSLGDFYTLRSREYINRVLADFWEIDVRGNMSIETINAVIE